MPSRRPAQATLGPAVRTVRVAGVGGYTDFPGRVAPLLSVEAAVAASERKLALARFAVHRALAGAWTAPTLAAEEPSMSAAFPPAGTG